ncbi:hypothetical protein B0O80DRAFT_494669 [Mortierella sp. GBAus27b]|nr:putative metallocarboxypeptidase ecm14 [Mortierella sp. GBA43]KAI8360507.1 hypothetical protein B0O80DRAFT_494669 [Mortierella sp. GBAus27b]
MRRLWTTASLALFAAVSLAYPRPPVSWQDLQQQLPFSPFHRTTTTQHSGANLGIDIDSESNAGSYARYDNEQVLRFEISSHFQLEQFQVAVEDFNLDLWTNLRIGTVDVRVPPSKSEAFKEATRNIPHTIMIPNLQDLIPQQAPASVLDTTTPVNGWDYKDNAFWYNYRDMATVNNFTEAMVKRYPKLVKRVSLGKTHEGREVFGLSIHGYKKKKGKGKKKGSLEDTIPVADDDEMDNYEDSVNDYEEGDDNGEDDGDNDYDGDSDSDDEDEDEEETALEQLTDKLESWWSWLVDRKPSKPKKNPKAIVIHAGQHAREWIGPAVVTYIARELIHGYRRDRKIKRLVDQFEFVIVPVLNPDGYVYTWEHDRMWRKNRQPTAIPFCPGIDPNRNWGYKWNKTAVQSNPNPCNEAHRGTKPFEALETKMLSKYILKRKNVVGYLDLHAYSQFWMSPFGGDCNEIPKDDEDITECAMGAAKALYNVHNKRFKVGRACNLVVPAAGGSIDWTYAVGKVKYSYMIELRDTGLHGFLLPASEILPSSQEILASVMYYANFIRKREKQWGKKHD